MNHARMLSKASKIFVKSTGIRSSNSWLALDIVHYCPRKITGGFMCSRNEEGKERALYYLN